MIGRRGRKNAAAADPDGVHRAYLPSLRWRVWVVPTRGIIQTWGPSQLNAALPATAAVDHPLYLYCGELAGPLSVNNILLDEPLDTVVRKYVWC
jgi:hypothetical protein